MIDRRAARLRLLRRQERTKLLPVPVGECRDRRQLQRNRGINRYSGSLAGAAQRMQAPSCRLVPASKVRPMQSPGLLLLRLAYCVQQATHFWEAELDPLANCSPFFSCARTCPCMTTRAA
jgi:hypothetical protein